MALLQWLRLCKKSDLKFVKRACTGYFWKHSRKWSHEATFSAKKQTWIASLSSEVSHIHLVYSFSRDGSVDILPVSASL